MNNVASLTRSMLTGGVLLGMLATAAVPAMAGDPITTSDQAKHIRRALDADAQCLLKSRSGGVERLLTMYPGSKDAVRLARFMNNDECTEVASGTVDLTFSPETLRGGLYKAVYARDFGGRGSHPLSQSSPDYAADAAGVDPVQAQAYATAHRFAECVVRKNPAAARAMVLSEAESPDEYDAIATLEPATSACLQPGQAMPTRLTVAGLVAEVLYRLSASGAPMGGGTGSNA